MGDTNVDVMHRLHFRWMVSTFQHNQSLLPLSEKGFKTSSLTNRMGEDGIFHGSTILNKIYNGGV